MDYLVIHDNDYLLPKAKASFIKSFVFSFQKFLLVLNVILYGEYLVDDENEGDTLVAITIGTGIGVERADFFSNHNIQNNK